ncbi:MAG: FkbM family methyltransferase [Kiloniellaceae bacterium]
MIASAVRVLRHKGPVGLLVGTYFLARIHIHRDLLGKRFIKKRIHDYWMFLDARDRGISRTLLLFGRREEDHRIILEKVLHEGMTVLDIGANIGYYALMESRLVGPSGRVIAVEPSPENVELLERNLATNGCDNVLVLPIAISDRSGRRALWLSELSNLHSFHEREDGSGHMSGQTIEVETRTVPDVMAGLDKPDLIRMDVEGHEVDVINGMLAAVENGDMAPMILFETHRRHYTADHDIVGPLSRLFDCGYRIRYAASSGEAGTRIIDNLGYKGSAPVKTDFMTRVIYENVRNDDLIDLICRTGGVRTVLLQKAA